MLDAALKGGWVQLGLRNGTEWASELSIGMGKVSVYLTVPMLQGC